VIFDLQKQYLTDANGNKIAVVIDIDTYQKLMEEIDELYCLKGYERAVAETEPEIATGDYVTLEEFLTNDETDS
jgi:PHD/YefM family antitoxin component YafN of YafNO toxin-antitoxin module